MYPHLGRCDVCHTVFVSWWLMVMLFLLAMFLSREDLSTGSSDQLNCWKLNCLWNMWSNGNQVIVVTQLVSWMLKAPEMMIMVHPITDTNIRTIKNNVVSVCVHWTHKQQSHSDVTFTGISLVFFYCQFDACLNEALQWTQQKDAACGA